ncbi:hypothetical protein [Lichenibacterium ramalinae]|uniref:Glutamine amidotransferase domain-containing protein n=1 Tax=Lichenibacterium ramalinae TaxID=2316527 RepID=A0A4Q2RCB3_9HYPH|nr:hypothetical protein [Lichenibacterium ramalinae]RYB04697.1 hypothetical protein D3272_12190 [Lichenibacterium ramalinae]
MTRFALSFTPLLPLALLWALAAVAVAVVALGLLGRRRGTLLRAFGLALLLLALADPSLVREDRKPEKDVVAVVIDQSGSQTIGERAAQTAKARDAIAKALAGLGDVDARFIDGGRSDADNDGTRLFASLSAGLADVPPERVAGVLMVTDGVVHDIPADVAALGFKAPLQVLVTGHAGERDRRIELLEAPRFGIVGKDQTVSLRVLDTDDRGEAVAVTVRRDGVEVARRQARVGARIDVPVRVDHAGPNVVEIDVPTIPGELTGLNNKAVVTIDGVRDKLKVLLVSGEPHAGERMWRNILKSDANVDLLHFTILRPPDKQDSTPINELALIAFPTSQIFDTKINDFDLIIFDRFSNQSILPYAYFENIARYVRNGGALLMAVGPDYSGPDGLYYSPLGAIAPVRPDGRVLETPFRAKVTAEGEKHPVTRGLAGGDRDPPAWSLWFRQVEGDATKGMPVLSGAEGRPLVVLSREGKGRVAQMLSDQIWLWARGYEDGGPYLDLTRRLAHWLMKEPDLEEEALRATAHGRDIAIERQSVKGVTAPVTVAAPSGAATTVTLTAAEPGLSRGSVRTDELGLYRLGDGTNSVLLNIGPENPREFQEVVSTSDKLRPLAEATGGSARRIGTGTGDDIAMPRIVAMHEAPSYSGSDYIGIRRTDSSTVAGVGLFPLAVGIIGLLALLGSTVLAWAVEGRGGRRRA